jgi:tetratricopeptide (TPR) repeat protein
VIPAPLSQIEGDKMKRVPRTLQVALAVAIVLAVASLAAAQTGAGTGSSQRPGATPPSNPQPQAAPGAKPAQAAPAPAPGKMPPQAKTQEEYKAFQEAYALGEPAAAEKAANDFAAKYKDSELRALLYHRAMSLYQNANNAEKTVEMGRRVLALDPTNPVALVTVSTVLAERTRDTDLDKQDRLNEAMTDAQKALQTIDTDLMVPPGTPPDKVEGAKKILLAMAWAAMGSVELSRNNYAVAEADLRKSVEINQVQPDAITYLRLSVVLDHQKKYADAMVAANKALDLSPAGSPQASLAQQERDRLLKLTGASAPAPAPAGTPAPPPPPPAGAAPPK